MVHFNIDQHSSAAPDVSLAKAHKLIDVEQEIKILEGKPDELISANTWEDLGLCEYPFYS